MGDARFLDRVTCRGCDCNGRESRKRKKERKRKGRKVIVHFREYIVAGP